MLWKHLEGYKKPRILLIFNSPKPSSTFYRLSSLSCSCSFAMAHTIFEQHEVVIGGFHIPVYEPRSNSGVVPRKLGAPSWTSLIKDLKMEHGTDSLYVRETRDKTYKLYWNDSSPHTRLVFLEPCMHQLDLFSCGPKSPQLHQFHDTDVEMFNADMDIGKLNDVSEELNLHPPKLKGCSSS